MWMWNCLELWFHCYHLSWAIKWCGRCLTVTVISHFTGDLSQLAAVPAPGKLSPCHLFKFQTLFCDQFQNISVPQNWPHGSWILSKELCGVARSSLALLSRIHAATEQKILHKKVLWVIVFGISRISLVFLQVSLLFSYSTFFCAWLPPLRRVFHHPGKWKAAINEVPVNCIGILAMNCNASQPFLSINWQIPSFDGSVIF